MKQRGGGNKLSIENNGPRVQMGRIEFHPVHGIGRVSSRVPPTVPRLSGPCMCVGSQHAYREANLFLWSLGPVSLFELVIDCLHCQLFSLHSSRLHAKQIPLNCKLGDKVKINPMDPMDPPPPLKLVQTMLMVLKGETKSKPDTLSHPPSAL